MLRRIPTRAAVACQPRLHAARAAGSKALRDALCGANRRRRGVCAAISLGGPALLRAYSSDGGNKRSGKTTETTKMPGTDGSSSGQSKKRRRGRSPTWKAQTELREVTEEMAAAARFSDGEWRAECRRARGLACRGVATALELLPGAEEAARRRLQDEEAAARGEVTQAELAARCLMPPQQVYRTVVAAGAAAEASGCEEAISRNVKQQLHWLREVLKYPFDEYLVYAAQTFKHQIADTSDQAYGLLQLYKELCTVGFPTDAVMRELLKTARLTNKLYFNATGEEYDFECYNTDIPSSTAYDFFHRLLRHLPALRQLSFSHLPPLSSPGALEALSGDAQALRGLTLAHTDYTVADLVAFSRRCMGRWLLYVNTSHCTDWGEYAAIADMRERYRRVKEACGGRIGWMN